MKRVSLFKQLHIGDKVLVSGVTSYSYYWGGIETKYWKRGTYGEIINKVAHKEPATVIQVTEHVVYLELDNSRKSYLTKSNIPEMDGVWVIPQKNIASVSIGDITCGDKIIELM